MNRLSDIQRDEIEELIYEVFEVSAPYSIPSAVRHELGLTQREARYEMTRAEASRAIKRLRAAQERGNDD